MPEIEIKEFDDFRKPIRRPWLLLVLLAVIIFVVVQRRRITESVKTVPREQQKAVEQPASAVIRKKIVPVEPSTINIKSLLSQAKSLEKQEAFIEARNKYLNLLQENIPARIRTEVERGLAGVNLEMVLTPRAMPEKVEYIVERGDSVQKIANRFGSTAELIQESNQIKNPNLIKIGDGLRIFTGKFAMTVSKTRNDLVLYMNDEFFKRYSVGTGKYGKTPVGTFSITEKIKEPVWWRPNGKEVPYGDKENILGTHWLTLRATGDTPNVKGYGLHGTWDDSSIGKSESAGCIRLKNSDVEQIFTLVPVGTPVTIIE